MLALSGTVMLHSRSTFSLSLSIFLDRQGDAFPADISERCRASQRIRIDEGSWLVIESPYIASWWLTSQDLVSCFDPIDYSIMSYRCRLKFQRFRELLAIASKTTTLCLFCLRHLQPAWLRLEIWFSESHTIAKMLRRSSLISILHGQRRE